MSMLEFRTYQIKKFNRSVILKWKHKLWENTNLNTVIGHWVFKVIKDEGT